MRELQPERSIRETPDGYCICHDCGNPLKPIYQNVGFTHPEGPEHWEIEGYEVCDHDDD